MNTDLDRPIRVAIALINRDGAYLVRQRPPLPGSPMPGVWEFPGGKCEPGETLETATVRECREETGMRVVVRRLRRVIEHRYPHNFVALHFFDAATETSQDEPATDSGFRWVAASELAGLGFPGANESILREIIEEASA